MKETGMDIEISKDILNNWQEIVDILAEIIQIPAALIMRYTKPHIEVLVSSNIKENPYQPGDKEILYGSGLYCEQVIKTQNKLLMPNALEDAKWKNNPDIKLNMISYLGFPILLPNKKPFGTVCVLDKKSNKYSKMTERLMIKFRNLIESHLEMAYMNKILGDKNRELTDYVKEIQALRGLVPICSYCKRIRDNQNNWHSIEHYLSQHSQAKFSHSICPQCMKEIDPDLVDNS